jgi:hypothetical protein
MSLFIFRTLVAWVPRASGLPGTAQLSDNTAERKQLIMNASD